MEQSSRRHLTSLWDYMSGWLQDLTFAGAIHIFCRAVIVFTGLMIFYLIVKRLLRTIEHGNIGQRFSGYFSRRQTASTPISDIEKLAPIQKSVRVKLGSLKAEPIGYRAFKSKGFVNLGISKIILDDYITIDKGHIARIQERARLFRALPAACLKCSDIAAKDVLELHRELVHDILPRQFPDIFTNKKGIFTNLITGSRYPVSARENDPISLLRTIGESVEEDFYLMLQRDPEAEYTLEAFVACFPSDFSPEKKFGLPMTDIHRPVPLYEQRLKKGVNRFFDRLKYGEIVERFNWSVQADHATLHRPGGDVSNSKSGNASKKADPLASYLRTERQTLRRLRTGAIVFGVRTYLYPLIDIKREGLGHNLADAIEALPESVGFYKNRPMWGETICAFLREP